MIDQVGPTRRVENLAAARNAKEINAYGRVVMPGFVDSHTHLIFPLGNAAGCDDESAIRAVRTGTGQRLLGRAQAHVDAMARHGTTTVEVKTGCCPDLSAETKLLRVLAALKDNPLHVVPTFLFHLSRKISECENAAREASEGVSRELLPRIQRRRLARFADLEWLPDPALQEHFDGYLELAGRLGFPRKVHAAESDPAAAVTLAVRHLAVSVDHLEYATARDIAMLSDTPTLATLTPGTLFHNGGRTAPARALIDNGVAVALATNFNPNHTPNLSMQAVIALACRHLGMTAAEAIVAATVNGAHALKRGDKTGSLEIGKSADLVLLNVPDYKDLPHNFGVNLVHMTLRRGETIYEEAQVGCSHDTSHPQP